VAGARGLDVRLRRPPNPGDHFRRAVAGLSRLSVTDVSSVAREWVDWAVSADDAAEAADAYWHLVMQVSTEVARRLSWPGRAEAVATSQGTAAEAGYWLLRAGRVKDAAVAIEAARGMLLRQRFEPALADLAGRLARAGRPDLHAAYVEAVARIDELQRGQYRGDPDRSGNALLVGGTRYWTGGVSSAHQAWSRYERVVADIAAVVDDQNPLLQPDWELIRSAATDGPLVYLAAAERSGYAILATPHAPDPVPIWLPRLDRSSLDGAVATYRTVVEQVRSSDATELPDLLKTLWTAAMSPLSLALPARQTLTVVAVGALGLLPLHAASDPAAGPDEPWYVGDRLAIRYAPNVRSALTARRVAVVAEPGPVLAVDAPEPVPGAGTIPRTAEETRGVERLYRPNCTRLPDARREQVIARLPGCSVWHFACHGIADPTKPLSSRLVLVDSDLPLRDILAMPTGRHRLAVLSACDSSVPDERRLDEVISFPGALLQAGVATVVASGWKVEDTAAQCLVLRFHQLIRQGRPPAVALADAQRWLRRATNADIEAVLPASHRPPHGLPTSPWRDIRPFDAPEYWAAFSVTGY